MTSTPSSAGNQHPEQVLYLDYDGVLHHDAVLRHPKRGIYIDANVAPERRLFEWTEFLIQAVQPFPRLQIVLSTSWVQVLGYTGARGHLPPVLASRVIGATFHRRLHKADSIREGGTLVPERGFEVMRDVSRRKPRQWVALDDSDEGWPDEHRHRVVLCDPSTGLSDAATRDRLQLALAKHFGPVNSTLQEDSQ